MIAKVLFSIVIMIFALYIGNKIILKRKIGWICLLIGILNAFCLIFFLIKGKLDVLFGYFIAFEVFTVIGVITLKRAPHLNKTKRNE